MTQDIKEALAQTELCKYGQEPKSCTSSPMDCQCAIDAALAQPEQDHIPDARKMVTEQEPVAHCEAGPNYCWKCLEELNPTYGSEEIKKLREVNKSLMKNIEELKKEPPPFWPVVQHLLDEYGLQFIDIVAAYREATQPEQEPVAWLSTDSIGERHLCFDKPLDNDPVQPLYTTPPKRTWVGLTDEEIMHRIDTHIGVPSPKYPLDNSDLISFARAIEHESKGKNT